MATYVLVHGAWGGAHGFRKVRPLLHADGRGHAVFTPSLTGIGERSHLTGPHVTLTTHICDVVNTVLYEDLDEIVLLGFSYGGMVVTGALEHIADRVRHLVYLDAFVPDDGDSVEGLLGRDDRAPIALGSAWLVPPIERELDDADETAWANERRTPQPIGCFTEQARLARPLEEHAFSRTYIKATVDPPGPLGPSPFWRVADRVRTSPAWRYYEIDTNHMIPNNRPKELAEILLALD